MALSKAALKRIIGAVPEPEDDDIGKWVVGVIRSVEAEVRKQDEALIRRLVEALVDLVEAGEDAWGDERPCVRIGKEEITTARARLEGNP